VLLVPVVDEDDAIAGEDDKEEMIVATAKSHVVGRPRFILLCIGLKLLIVRVNNRSYTTSLAGERRLR